MERREARGERREARGEERRGEERRGEERRCNLAFDRLRVQLYNVRDHFGVDVVAGCDEYLQGRFDEPPRGRGVARRRLVYPGGEGDEYPEQKPPCHLYYDLTIPYYDVTNLATMTSLTPLL